MKTHSIGAMMLAAGLCFASVAQAQHRPFHGERDSQRQVEQRADGRNGQGRQREFRRDRRGSDHRIDRRDHRRLERIQQRHAHRHFRRDHRPFYGHHLPPRAAWHGGHRGVWHGGHRGVWRGAGPVHRIHRGGRLPPQYRGRHYVVENWRAHRLTRPPRGYHWVQTGPDYVLAAIATGVILHIMLGG